VNLFSEDGDLPEDAPMSTGQIVDVLQSLTLIALAVAIVLQGRAH
jgi:hypothetical protein